MNPCRLVTIVIRLTNPLIRSKDLIRRGVTHPLPEAPNKLPTCLARQSLLLPTQLVLLARKNLLPLNVPVPAAL